MLTNYDEQSLRDKPGHRGRRHTTALRSLSVPRTAHDWGTGRREGHQDGLLKYTLKVTFSRIQFRLRNMIMIDVPTGSDLNTKEDRLRSYSSSH
jgi:hypothetical protein